MNIKNRKKASYDTHQGMFLFRKFKDFYWDIQRSISLDCYGKIMDYWKDNYNHYSENDKNAIDTLKVFLIDSSNFKKKLFEALELMLHIEEQLFPSTAESLFNDVYETNINNNDIWYTSLRDGSYFKLINEDIKFHVDETIKTYLNEPSFIFDIFFAMFSKFSVEHKRSLSNFRSDDYYKDKYKHPIATLYLKHRTKMMMSEKGV